MRSRQKMPPPFEETEDRRNRRWTPLIFLLFFLALLTTSAAGYLLGKRTGQVPGGQIIDTILLAPESNSEISGETDTILHLTGRVMYSNQIPAAGQLMELRSEPVQTVTDSAGVFLFPCIQPGNHTLSVINEDGKILASRELWLEKKTETEGISVHMNDEGIYMMEMSVNVRILEISIVFDQDAYYISQDMLTYATTDGVVVMPGRRASLSDGPVVTPAGAICLPDGKIILPGGGSENTAAVILPDDTVVYPKDTFYDGTVKIEPDGTVTLPDGTVIEPNKGIRTPEEASDKDKNGETNETKELAVLTEGAGQEHPDTGAEEDTQPSADSGTEGSSGDDSGSGGGSGSENGSDGGDSSGPSDQESTAGSTEAPDNGGLDVLGRREDTDTYISWKQSSTIDLFYNRYDNRETPIAPGSSGYYQFRLVNTRKEELSVQVVLTEESELHLPLHFTLRSQNGNKLLQRFQPAGGSLEGYHSKLVLETEIEGGVEADFRLEWEWPAEGNDAQDTAAGKNSGDYLLTLTIHAEGNQ